VTFNSPGQHSDRGSSFLSDSDARLRSTRPASAIRSPEANGGGVSASRLCGDDRVSKATGTGSVRRCRPLRSTRPASPRHRSPRPLRVAVGPKRQARSGKFSLGSICWRRPLRTRTRVPERPALANVPMRSGVNWLARARLARGSSWVPFHVFGVQYALGPVSAQRTGQTRVCDSRMNVPSRGVDPRGLPARLMRARRREALRAHDLGD
jgi:hypothetical protein